MPIGAIILDGCVLALLIFFSVRGGKWGLVKTIFGLFTGILSLLLAWKLYPIVSDLLASMGLKDSIQSGLIERLELPAATGVSQETAAIGALSLPQMLKDWLIQNNNYEVYEALGVSNFHGYVAGYLTNLAMNILSLLLTFVASFLILRLISGLLGFINKIPVIGGINKILGIAAGLLLGLLIIWGVFLLITFMGLATMSTPVLEAIENSKISSFLYDHNWLLEISAQIFH